MRALVACSVVGLFLLSLITADAADGDKGKEKGKPSPEMMFKKLDANGDGKITKEEFVKLAELAKEKGADGKGKEFLEKIFSKLDANGDGSLTMEEFKKFAEMREKKKDNN